MLFWRPKRIPHSVLHVSYMVHIAYETVELLKRHGQMRAEYLAVGVSDNWSQCDQNLRPSRWPFFRAFQEFWCLWTYVLKFEIVHSHFMVGISDDGWEWPIIKRAGIKMVAHWRGCDIRYRSRNYELAPQYNICEQCDYNYVCETPVRVRRRILARQWADLELVTTPDLLDFSGRAVYFPFFAPLGLDPRKTTSTASLNDIDRIRIVHATNHPGIEGTREIQKVMDELIAEGYPIDFVYLKGVSPERVREEMATADFTIGKMKMGYYANTQIESMCLGVPAITYVRSEFRTPEVAQSGLILSSLETLKHDLREIIKVGRSVVTDRQELKAKITTLHNNSSLVDRLGRYYLNF